MMGERAAGDDRAERRAQAFCRRQNLGAGAIELSRAGEINGGPHGAGPVGTPVDFTCSGQFNCPCAKVLPAAKRLCAPLGAIVSGGPFPHHVRSLTNCSMASICRSTASLAGPP